jgi:HD-GYP domain-containing protein (c-di-GMP phosphodiesterase class II)
MCAQGEQASTAPLWRYLPLSLLATTTVVFVPVALAVLAIPPGGAARALAATAVAALLSLLVASAASAAWKRWHGSHDVLFPELMLWAWFRRCLSESRLRRMRATYESSTGAPPELRVRRLEELSKLLAARSAYTHGHCRRVARHSERIARSLHLSNGEIATIRTAAVIHDVGKVYTPREILAKPGALTEEEFAVVKRHTIDGATMLGAVGDRELTRIVLHHHERLDGSGYPSGLVGDEIPIGARIVAVADTFDAITSRRPYRRAGTQRQALQILASETPRKFDQRVVSAFTRRDSPGRSAPWVAVLAALGERVSSAFLLGAGALGGGAGQVLPVLGAAGLLAVVPAARFQREPRRPAPAAHVASVRAPLASPGEAPVFAVARPGAGGSGHANAGPPARAHDGPTRAQGTKPPAPTAAGSIGAPARATQDLSAGSASGSATNDDPGADPSRQPGKAPTGDEPPRPGSPSQPPALPAAPVTGQPVQTSAGGASAGVTVSATPAAVNVEASAPPASAPGVTTVSAGASTSISAGSPPSVSLDANVGEALHAGVHG